MTRQDAQGKREATCHDNCLFSFDFRIIVRNYTRTDWIATTILLFLESLMSNSEYSITVGIQTDCRSHRMEIQVNDNNTKYDCS